MLGTETISITINVREQKLVKKDRKCKNLFSCVLVFKKNFETPIATLFGLCFLVNSLLCSNSLINIFKSRRYINTF